MYVSMVVMANGNNLPHEDDVSDRHRDGPVPGPRDPRDDPADADRLRGYALALAGGVDAALGPWVVASVERVLLAWTAAPDRESIARAIVALAPDGAGSDTSSETWSDQARQAGQNCRDEVGPAVRALLLTDIDDQRGNPLEIIRRGVTYPTTVLRSLGVPAMKRDASAQQHFPDDDYDLTPASFAELSPGLHDLGLHWGAAKAHIHLRRRRADGQR